MSPFYLLVLVWTCDPLGLYVVIIDDSTASGLTPGQRCWLVGWLVSLKRLSMTKGVTRAVLQPVDFKVEEEPEGMCQKHTYIRHLAIIAT